MRTLTLLASLLLLALHGKAGSLGDTADPVMAPKDQLPTQAQAGAKDQDVAISFERPFAPAAAGPGQRVTCYCRSLLCYSWETVSGTCTLSGYSYVLCCS
ncbi:defensin alpha 5 [Talpa occidentalis]|uniref:defensin alpha 5 n=1 Tax=Talpa occidentalis TaxID=50954 RepID=UPI00188E737D|nr:defensin alpha 5 [Talpa occidentalis]